MGTMHTVPTTAEIISLSADVPMTIETIRMLGGYTPTVVFGDDCEGAVLNGEKRHLSNCPPGCMPYQKNATGGLYCYCRECANCTPAEPQQPKTEPGQEHVAYYFGWNICPDDCSPCVDVGDGRIECKCFDCPNCTKVEPGDPRLKTMQTVVGPRRDDYLHYHDSDVEYCECPANCKPMHFEGTTLVSMCKACPHRREIARVEVTHGTPFLTGRLYFDGCPADCEPYILRDGEVYSKCYHCEHCTEVDRLDPILETMHTVPDSTGELYAYDACPENCRDVIYRCGISDVHTCKVCPHRRCMTSAERKKWGPNGGKKPAKQPDHRPTQAQQVQQDDPLPSKKPERKRRGWKTPITEAVACQHLRKTIVGTDSHGEHLLYHCSDCGAIIGFDYELGEFRRLSALESYREAEHVRAVKRRKRLGRLIYLFIALAALWIVAYEVIGLVFGSPESVVYGPLVDIFLTIIRSAATIGRYAGCAILAFVARASIMPMLNEKHRNSNTTAFIVQMLCTILLWLFLG